MNEQYEISLHEFRQYPKISEKTIASTKIFVIGYFIGIFIIAAGVHWGNKYPSSTQRGQRPQPAHYRPLLVGPFEFYSGPLSTDKDADCTLPPTLTITHSRPISSLAEVPSELVSHYIKEILFCVISFMHLFNKYM
jgi:hypothetical protein